jgi:hypothetical protein
MYVLNQGVDDGIMDNVYDRFRKWPRFTLTEERAQADLLIVLSEDPVFKAQPSAEGPRKKSTLLISSRYLIVVDEKTSQQLLVVSCVRTTPAATGKALVDRLKQRFPKKER